MSPVDYQRRELTHACSRSDTEACDICYVFNVNLTDSLMTDVSMPFDRRHYLYYIAYSLTICIVLPTVSLLLLYCLQFHYYYCLLSN